MMRLKLEADSLADEQWYSRVAASARAVFPRPERPTRRSDTMADE
jgi:hypothetical protein